MLFGGAMVNRSHGKRSNVVWIRCASLVSGGLRAVSTLALTSFRHVDRTVDADEADLMVDQRFDGFLEPAALEEDVIDDKTIASRRECGKGAMEP